ncbi:MAG: trypsin-like peptidase domain-containing protein, partial [Sciscionella sp.]|nr:trypsin-like peptidase domain-containing protein [Sciscionella sp.]
MPPSDPWADPRSVGGHQEPSQHAGYTGVSDTGFTGPTYDPSGYPTSTPGTSSTPGAGGFTGPSSTSVFGTTGSLPATPTQPKPRRKAPIAVVAALSALLGAGVGLGGGYLLLDNNNYSSAPALESHPASGSATSAKAGSVQYAAQKATKSTVDIETQQDEGTGIVLTADGYLLTNNHVISSASNGGRIQVTLPDGSKKSAKIVGTAPSYDLAVLKVDASGLTPAELGQSSGVAVGQPVAAVGSPFGLTDTVTSGIVSALNRTVTVQADSGQLVVYPSLQTDASINPGNSGGPLVNMDGQVIGVNSSINTGDQNSSQGGAQGGSIGLGFSIPVDIARRVANDLMHTGSTQKPVLGVSGNVDSSGSGSGSSSNGAS